MSFRARFSDSLALNYMDPSRAVILHEVPLCNGCVLFVVGDPDNGSYEWVIQRGRDIEHSDCGYGVPFVALRDGLIVYWGPPDGDGIRPSVKTTIRVKSHVRLGNDIAAGERPSS